MKSQNESKLNNWLVKQTKAFEENYFGAMTMMMVGQSCLGSVAAMYALQSKNVPFLIISIVLTMTANAAFLGQIPPKWGIRIFGASVVVNTILVVLSFLMA